MPRTWNKRVAFWSWTQTAAIHSWTEIVRVLLHAAIKRLPVINTSPLHMQSTHGAAHNNPGRKERGKWRKKKTLNHEPSFISQTALTLCFVSQLRYQPLFLSAACMSQTVGEGWRARTLKNPFTQPWVVTWIQWDRGEGHSTLKLPGSTAHVSLPPPDMLSQPSSGIPCAWAKLPYSILHSVSESSLQAMQKHLATLGLRRKLFFCSWSGLCVYTELQMNCTR